MCMMSLMINTLPPPLTKTSWGASRILIGLIIAVPRRVAPQSEIDQWELAKLECEYIIKNIKFAPR
jgi:hypothetical protein